MCIVLASVIYQDDDFEKLRVMREKERQDRVRQKMARSISNQPGGIDADILLEQLGSRSEGLGLSNRSLYDQS